MYNTALPAASENISFLLANKHTNTSLKKQRHGKTAQHKQLHPSLILKNGASVHTEAKHKGGKSSNTVAWKCKPAAAACRTISMFTLNTCRRQIIHMGPSLERKPLGSGAPALLRLIIKSENNELLKQMALQMFPLSS